MFEIGVVAQFEAAHQLVGNFGPATRLHGHTYRLEVVLRGAQLQPDGTLYDLGALGAAVAALVGRLHYRNLADVPGLAGTNTTAEHVALFCWNQLAPELRQPGLTTLVVRVWESPQAYAAFEDRL